MSKMCVTVFRPGDLIIYQNGDRFEIGKIKRLVDDGAFVWYSSGETAAKTSFSDMRPLRNAHVITDTSLGGMDGKRRRILVHGAMVYGCQDCGARWLMYLEKGLEEEGDPDRKPVPFGIICPYCKGFHAFDISGYLKIPEDGYQELPKDASYFENLPDRDCGKPCISPTMRRLKDDEIPSARILRKSGGRA